MIPALVRGSRPLLVRAAALAALLALCACVASAERGGPLVSPTGIEYDLGTPPEETRLSQTASLYLRSGDPERAVEFAREGIEEDPGNPIHFFLAGVASIRLGRYEEADSMFVEAERRYPAYELDVEPEREAAWAQAFNEGAEAYAAGDLDDALEAWRAAARIYALRPEAHRNLAMLLHREAEYEEAVEVYEDALAGLEREPATRVLEEEEARAREEVAREMEASLADLLLELSRYEEAEPLLRRQLERDPSSVRLRQNLALALDGQGRREEAAEIYGDLLSDAELAATELFNLGVALFRTGDFSRAAEAFERLTELRPRARDAWFNYANSLFAAEEWAALASIEERLLAVDPLGETAGLITARAHLELGDEERALAGLERVEDAPVYVEGLAIQPAPQRTIVQGRLTGNRVDAGTPVRLRFTFYGEGEEVVGAETLTLSAPAADGSVAFEVEHAGRATGYRYELLGFPR